MVVGNILQRGKMMKKNLLVILACVLISLCVISCDDPKHEHAYGTKWEYDDTNHWHECSCGAKSEEAAHKLTWTASDDGSKDYQKCSVCEYKSSEVDHTYGAWEKADDSHVKRTCDKCCHEEIVAGAVVSSESELKTAIEAGGARTICLKNDLEIKNDITINKGQTITLDLNGKNITFTEKRFIISAQNNGYGGSLIVEGKGKISKPLDKTSRAVRGIFKMEGNGDSTKTVSCKLTIGKDVEIEGPLAIWVQPESTMCFDVTIDINGTVKGLQPVYVNGNISNVDENDKLIEKERAVRLNINDGAKIISTAEMGLIYLPGYAKTVIGKAYIESKEGNDAIVYGGGELIINGATIKGGQIYKKDAGQNGAMDTYSCAAIHVGQNTKKHHVYVEINSGTFYGYIPFYQANERAGYEDNDLVEIKINGGTFIKTVKTEDSSNPSASVKALRATKFIYGGTFSTEPDSTYIADGYKVVADGDNWTVVKK